MSTHATRPIESSPKVRPPRFDRYGRELASDLYLASHRTAWILSRTAGKTFPKDGEVIVTIEDSLYVVRFADGRAVEAVLVGLVDAVGPEPVAPPLSQNPVFTSDTEAFMRMARCMTIGVSTTAIVLVATALSGCTG